MRTSLKKAAESIKPCQVKVARNTIAQGKVTTKAVRTVRRNIAMPTSILATKNKSNKCFDPIQQPERMRKRCKFCAYSPIGTSNMATHVKCFHDKIKAIKCSRCLFSTSSNSKLERHQKRVHSKIEISLKIKD